MSQSAKKANRQLVCERYELYDEARLKAIRASPAFHGMADGAKRTIDAILREAEPPAPEVRAPPGTLQRTIEYFRKRHTPMRSAASTASELTGRAWATPGAYQVCIAAHGIGRLPRR